MSGAAAEGRARFDDLVRGHRNELHAYCYRMLGSFEEAEDHVQEVLLRAWRSWEGFQGKSSPRTWLYRIATNACLDTLRRNGRRAPAGERPSVSGMPWLQPYPDALLAEIATDQPDPETAAVRRETMSLAFLAAIQLLPPRQRATLILRDVLNHSANEVAAMLGTSTAAANSALQRARAALRDQWPGGRLDWAPVTRPDPEQRRLLQRFIAAHEQADPDALIAVLGEDVRLAISGVGEWHGHARVADALRKDMTTPGQWRILPIRANGQAGAAGYVRPPGQDRFHPFVLVVLGMAGGRVVDIAAFEQPSLFPAFGLPEAIAG
jgi:RNA polymerase sigma-70 factor (ECF subfamily)